VSAWPRAARPGAIARRAAASRCNAVGGALRRQVDTRSAGYPEVRGAAVRDADRHATAARAIAVRDEADCSRSPA